jgi:hypothetical protein
VIDAAPLEVEHLVSDYRQSDVPPPHTLYSSSDSNYELNKYTYIAGKNENDFSKTKSAGDQANSAGCLGPTKATLPNQTKLEARTSIKKDLCEPWKAVPCYQKLDLCLDTRKDMLTEASVKKEILGRSGKMSPDNTGVAQHRVLAEEANTKNTGKRIEADHQEI